MTPDPTPAQPPGPGRSPSAADLTIGELARRTGLAPATVRMWESRHGFPRPTRQKGGHRRYDERQVELINQVLRRRDAGVRLEVAIAGVARAEAAMLTPPGAPSVYAALRRLHPALQPQRLQKSTLKAVSWAIEDECCARADQPLIFGAFQQERYFRAAEDRWTELARVARSSVVFATFGPNPSSRSNSVLVSLPEDAPMRREWAVVCDAPDQPAALTAWEIPGQSSVPDKQRQFESVWTVEPAAVRDAARACAQVAHLLGHAEAGPLLHQLAADLPPAPAELVRATSLLNRVVAYVDQAG